MPHRKLGWLLTLLFLLALHGFVSAQTTVSLQLSADTVSASTVTTATATVTTAGSPAKVGIVDFFDGKQVVSSVQIIGIASSYGAIGTASFRKVFAPGTHTLKAVYRGTLTIPAATSSPAVLTVTGTHAVDSGLQYAGTTDLSNHGLWDYTTSFALGDINNDGTPDLLFPHFNEDELAIALGNQPTPGTFTVTPPFLVNGSPEADQVVTADLNGDGLLDIVVVHSYANFASVYLATAPGVFAAPTSISSFGLNAPFGSFAVADINGDGLPDIVQISATISTPMTVVTWFNDPAHPGTFSPPNAAIITSKYFSGRLQMADMNGDGLMDLVTAPTFLLGSQYTSVAVLLNDPSSPGLSWNFAVYDLPVNSRNFAVADLNGDGLPDVASDSGSGSLFIQLNDLSHPGTLLPPQEYPAPGAMQNTDMFAIAAGDVNGDGIPDIAIADANNHFLVFNGNGDGTFTPGTPITISPTPLAYPQLYFAWRGDVIGIADLDGDGFGDVVLNQATQNSVQVYRHAATPGALVQTATDISVSTTSLYQGQPFTITATETAATGNMTGTVELFELIQNGNFIHDQSIAIVPISAGTVQFTVANATVGAHQYALVFHGDATFAVSQSAVAEITVLPIPPSTTTLTVTPNPGDPFDPETLTATVKTTMTNPVTVFSGTVQFYEGATLLGTSNISSTGVATLAYTFPLGAHILTAVFNGCPQALPSTSAPVTLQIIPPDFSLSLTPESVSLQTEHHAYLTLTAQSIARFRGDLSLACANLPAHASCTFSPQPLYLPAGDSASSQLILDTDDVHLYVFNRNYTAPVLCFLAMPLLLFNRSRRKLALVLSFATLTFLSAATGCSGKIPAHTAPGTYTIQINAQSTNSPLNHTVALTFTITP